MLEFTVAAVWWLLARGLTPRTSFHTGQRPSPPNSSLHPGRLLSVLPSLLGPAHDTACHRRMETMLLGSHPWTAAPASWPPVRPVTAVGSHCSLPAPWQALRLLPISDRVVVVGLHQPDAMARGVIPKKLTGRVWPATHSIHAPLTEAPFSSLKWRGALGK